MRGGNYFARSQDDTMFGTVLADTDSVGRSRFLRRTVCPAWLATLERTSQNFAVETYAETHLHLQNTDEELS